MFEKVAPEGHVDDFDVYDITYDSWKYKSSIITIALIYGIMFVNTKLILKYLPWHNIVYDMSLHKLIS